MNFLQGRVAGAGFRAPGAGLEKAQRVVKGVAEESFTLCIPRVLRCWRLRSSIFCNEESAEGGGGSHGEGQIRGDKLPVCFPHGVDGGDATAGVDSRYSSYCAHDG